MSKPTDAKRIAQAVSSRRLSEFALTENERSTVLRAHRALANSQFKHEADRFAVNVVKPQLELMKAAKKSGETSQLAKAIRDASVRASRAGAPIVGASRRVPRPPEHYPPCWHQGSDAPFGSSSWGGPDPETTAPADGSGGFGPSWVVMAERADSRTGIFSLAAAIGSWVGAKKGNATWIFGDSTIAQGQINSLLIFPSKPVPRLARVSVDVQVGDSSETSNDGTFLLRQADPGWVGTLGIVTLGLFSTWPSYSSIQATFLRAWASATGDSSPANGGIFQPQFTLEGALTIPPSSGWIIAAISVTLSALRLAGDEFDAAGVAFVDRDEKAPPLTIPSAGPVRVSNMEAVICP
jgi:hypothetical protein